MPHASSAAPLQVIIWVLAGAACALPFVGVAAVVVPHVMQREATRRQAEVDASLDRQEAEQTRRDADRERAERMARSDDRFLAGLESTNPQTQCEAAVAIGRTRRTEFARTLHAMLLNSANDSLTICVAHGLIGLGETDAPLHVFQAWAEGDDRDRKRAAVMIFGEIGPSSADIALPHAADELESPHADVRLNAAYALTRLGPKARGLLERAARDEDSTVRTIARDGLARLAGPS